MFSNGFVGEKGNYQTWVVRGWGWERVEFQNKKTKLLQASRRGEVVV